MSSFSRTWIPDNLYYCCHETYYGNVEYLYPITNDDKRNKRYIDIIKNKDCEYHEIDNKPRSGFRIEFIKYDWYIIDPRGFKVKLSTNLFSNFIKKCVIDNGEIISKCVWGWDKSPVIISDEFDEYNNILQNSKRIECKVKNLVPGNSYTNSNGDTEVYLGKFYYNKLDIIENKSSIFMRSCYGSKNQRNIDSHREHISFNVTKNNFSFFTGKKIYDIDNSISDKLDEYKEILKKSKINITDKKVEYTIQVIDKCLSRPWIKKYSSITDNKMTVTDTDFYGRSHSIEFTKMCVIKNNDKFFVLYDNNNSVVEEYGYSYHIVRNSKKYLSEIDINEFNKKLNNIIATGKRLEDILRIASKDLNFVEYSINEDDKVHIVSTCPIYYMDMVIKKC